jgi:cytochrome c553
MKTLCQRLMFISLLLMGLSAFAAPQANAKKGKIMFKKYCRVCHDGSTEAKTLQPTTKTMAQWTADFAEGGATQHCAQRAKEKTEKDLSAQDMLDIQAYLIQHAADSDQPATCGN